MNSITKVLPLVGLSSLFLALPSPLMGGREMTLIPIAAIAQENPVKPAHLDIELLVKTVENFFSGDRYETESQISLNGKGNGFSFMVRARTKVILDHSQKFRSQFIFVDDMGEIQQEYELISDGEQVWLYDKKMNQYTTRTQEEFFDSDNFMALGISSLIFVELSNSIRELRETQGDNFSLEQILLEAISDSEIPFQQNIYRWNNQEYYAYEIDDPAAGFKMSLLVDPKTAILKQIILSGSDENVEEFVLRENIIRRQELSSSENTAFQFTPPADVKQVEAIDIFDF